MQYLHYFYTEEREVVVAVAGSGFLKIMFNKLEKWFPLRGELQLLFRPC